MKRLRCYGGPLDGKERENENPEWRFPKVREIARPPLGQTGMRPAVVEVVYHLYAYKIVRQDDKKWEVWEYRGEC